MNEADNPVQESPPSAPVDDNASDAAAGDQESQDSLPEPEDSFPEDSFPTETPTLLVDPNSLQMISNRTRGPPSVATTELASSIGSTVRAPRDPFLKSITFYKDRPSDLEWGIQFCPPRTPVKKRNIFSRNKQKLYVESISGCFALSRIKEGDYLKSINEKRIGPSFSAERALEYMKTCLERDGILSVVTANKEEGDDILVQATIIKPKPNMSCEQLGMVVWFWGFLCIKTIDEESIFKQTALKEGDHLVSVNDIELEEVSPEQFNHIIKELPFDITITVLRRKQRYSGKFG